jgi:TPR repeat protein
MSEEEIENLWNQVLVAQETGDENLVISSSKMLSDAGDWRGSYTLGYTYEVKATRVTLQTGKTDRADYIAAAHCYNRAISQGGGYAPHNGLATYYYYGLGGEYNFHLAAEHLTYCIENAPNLPILDDATRKNEAMNQIMMAELLFLGYGIPKDVNAAKKLFLSAAKVGYPVAVIGLSRIEKSRKHYLLAIYFFLCAVRMAIKLVRENRNHSLLAGMGGKRQTFRRDKIK